MINSGRCPKCEKVLTAVRIEDVDVQVGFQNRWRGISYCCVYCNAAIGVGIDPIALKTDIVQQIIGALRGKLS